MPYLTIHTNVNFSDGQSIAEESSELTSRILHKPLSYIASDVLYNPNMAFGGKCSNKGALVELKSIGLGDKDLFVSELTKYLAQKLFIEDINNINIALIDSPATQTASGGKTFG